MTPPNLADLLTGLARVADWERDLASDVEEFGHSPRTTESRQALVGELRELAANANRWADDVHFGDVAHPGGGAS